MPTHPTVHDEVSYRAVIASPDARFFLVNPEADCDSLPQITIPKWTRPAEQIQAAFARDWELEVVVLDFLNEPGERSPCVVVQILAPFPGNRFEFASLGHFSETDLTDAERKTVQSICGGNAGDRGPFSRTGWIVEAMQWINEATNDQVQLSGTFRQLNASGAFALIHFEANSGKPLWLKAAGEPNRHEFEITVTLSTIVPTHLPPLVASRRDWNAWLMEDAGEPLGHRADALVFSRALVSLAELQKATIHHTDLLLAAGAFHQSTAVLREHAGEMIDYLRFAMKQQTSTKVAPLQEDRLREIETALVNACTALEDLGIPETIVHGDLNRSNILLGQDSIAFTDWCEGYVGNAFVAPQQLLALYAKTENSLTADHDILARAYKQRWLGLLTSNQIDRGFALAPLVAVASYLYGRGDWLRSPRRLEPGVQSYARSLARHMDRAVHSLSTAVAL
jgi:hypothetical protein